MSRSLLAGFTRGDTLSEGAGAEQRIFDLNSAPGPAVTVPAPVAASNIRGICTPSTSSPRFPATSASSCHATRHHANSALSIPRTGPDGEFGRHVVNPSLILTSLQYRQSPEQAASPSWHEMVLMRNQNTDRMNPEQNKDHRRKVTEQTDENMWSTGPGSSDEVAKPVPIASPLAVAVVPPVKRDEIEETSRLGDGHKHNSEHTKPKNTGVRTAVPGWKRMAPPRKSGQTAGRWTNEEHQAFLEGLKIHGREWKKVASRIPTRTSAQIRSHAQKYFSKVEREESAYLQEQHHLHHQPVAPSLGGLHMRQHSGFPLAPAIAPLPGVSLAVRRNMDRIAANPERAQREVEDTLRQLRERYRQLQVRLNESNGRRRRHPNAPMQRLAEDVHQLKPLYPEACNDRRKRTFDAMQDTVNADDLSSVSSGVSTSSVAMSPTREELIALHVLGGDLPRSLSNQDLPPMDISEPNEGSARSQEPSTGGPGHEKDQMP